jgi:hypothetical protein
MTQLDLCVDLYRGQTTKTAPNIYGQTHVRTYTTVCHELYGRRKCRLAHTRLLHAMVDSELSELPSPSCMSTWSTLQHFRHTLGVQ